MKTLPKFSQIDTFGGMALGLFASISVVYLLLVAVPNIA